jgi:hypothetical protein
MILNALLYIFFTSIIWQSRAIEVRFLQISNFACNVINLFLSFKEFEINEFDMCPLNNEMILDAFKNASLLYYSKNNINLNVIPLFYFPDNPRFTKTPKILANFWRKSDQTLTKLGNVVVICSYLSSALC